MTLRPVISPNTGTAVGNWAMSDAHSADDALSRLEAGVAALDPLEARREALDRLAAAIIDHRSAIEAMIVIEVAKTPAEAVAEVDYALSFVTFARELMDQHDFEVSAGLNRRVRKVGYGPTLLITPFNDPIAGIVRKLAPSIAAGSPALVKPSPAAAATALLLGEAMHAAGLGDIARVLALPTETAGRVIDDDRIGLVSFTGSTEAGLVVAARAARASKPAITELGGNNPFVICADADIDLAIDQLFIRKLRAAGQACSSVNRVYAHRDVFSVVRDRIADRASRIVTGASDEPDVMLGPVISAAAMERLYTLAGQAHHEGGRWLSAPAPSRAADGPFVMPLMVLESDRATCLNRKESFGPLMTLTAFDDEQQLIARFKRERHALCAYFYAADPDRLSPALAELRFGSIGMNTTAIQAAAAPTGGFRLAGVGREGGRWGFDAFLTTINIVSS